MNWQDSAQSRRVLRHPCRTVDCSETSSRLLCPDGSGWRLRPATWGYSSLFEDCSRASWGCACCKLDQRSLRLVQCSADWTCLSVCTTRSQDGELRACPLSHPPLFRTLQSQKVHHFQGEPHPPQAPTTMPEMALAVGRHHSSPHWHAALGQQRAWVLSGWMKKDQREHFPSQGQLRCSVPNSQPCCPLLPPACR